MAAFACLSWICLKTLPIPGFMSALLSASRSWSRRRILSASRGSTSSDIGQGTSQVTRTVIAGGTIWIIATRRKARL